jgi:hypothetical protein
VSGRRRDVRLVRYSNHFEETRFHCDVWRTSQSAFYVNLGTPGSGHSQDTEDLRPVLRKNPTRARVAAFHETVSQRCDDYRP